jgi:hydrogenase maturation protease
VGVGNVLMGDDGVGPAAIEVLSRRGLGGSSELIDAGLAFGEVLCDLSPDRPLVIIDAARGGGPPGSIYRLGLEELAEGGSMAAAVSLHEVSIVPALRMAALAGRRFADVTLFGVEPQRVAWAEGLSAPVAAAVERLADEIRRHLGARAAPSAAAGRSSSP